MLSYPLFIDNQEVNTGKWCYTINAKEWIDRPRYAFSAKRGIELGKKDEAEFKDIIAGRCAIGNGDENRHAMEAARRAALEFADTSLQYRLNLVLDIEQNITDRFQDIVDILVAEGHPRKLAEWEIKGINRDTIEWLASQMEQTFQLGRQSVSVLRKPDGVVAINPPQNAAASNSALGVYALLSGNALIIKAPKSCPLGVHFFYREIVQPVLDKHGAPKGLINIVSGNSETILSEWLNSPHVDDILFFGSSRTGLKFGESCIAKGKKPILELSGNDSFTVWQDADLDQAASHLLESFYGSSQICMVPKLAVVHPKIADEFLEILTERVRNLRPMYPDSNDATLSPVLKTHEFFEFLAEATSQGAKMLCGGERVDINGEPDHQGAFLTPTVVRVDGLTLASSLKCVTEETFFPLLPVVVPEESSDLLDDTIKFLSANKYGLRASLWARDEAVIRQFTRRLNNVGQIKVNCSHIEFAPVIATHGGPGLTGGPHGELNYVTLRTSHLQGLCVKSPNQKDA